MHSSAERRLAACSLLLAAWSYVPRPRFAFGFLNFLGTLQARTGTSVSNHPRMQQATAGGGGCAPAVAAVLCAPSAVIVPLALVNYHTGRRAHPLVCDRPAAAARLRAPGARC